MIDNRVEPQYDVTVGTTRVFAGTWDDCRQQVATLPDSYKGETIEIHRTGLVIDRIERKVRQPRAGELRL
ncbi:hypothetical protein MUG78_17650 [Gordonia alkaliphila]|uniref:hypothetical protein n=1 Tax=Gordonia alkaliphila TaxID=1053547 RepID=UPI001FF3EBF7|nr:hypothetical protein [Gordonia alkaliphila]MCK0441226.1 hypothetical protein [Gordonia alkaliphila]